MAELKDALDRAANDSAFAKRFVEDPAQFKDEYSLTDDQIQRIKEASASDVFGYVMMTGTSAMARPRGGYY